MSKLSMRGRGTVNGIVSAIVSGLEAGSVSCTLCEKAERNFGDTKIVMLVFEKYYWRAGNRASLSVLVSGKNENVIVDAVSSGGGQGIFFSFSWGAEESFLESLRDILNEYRFTEIY